MTSQDTKNLFYLYEVPPSRVAKQGDRSSHPGAASNAWTMRISDVVDTGDIEGWFSKDLLKTCASFESASELDLCQMVMTASVMGDCQCSIHARTSPTNASCARTERTFLADQRTPVPAH